MDDSLLRSGNLMELAQTIEAALFSQRAKAASSNFFNPGRHTYLK